MMARGRGPGAATARGFALNLLGASLLGLSLASPAPAPGAEAAPGSWQARTPSLLLAVPGWESVSAALQPPALALGRHLAEVRWRFSLPAGAAVKAWLCHPERCIELVRNWGGSSALAGLDAGQPLQFRFRLAPRAEPVPVRDVELLVEYR